MEPRLEEEKTTGTLNEWLSLVDFARPAENAESCWLRMGAFIAGCTAILYVMRGNVDTLIDAQPLPNLTPDEHIGYRYGLPEEKQREIFEELATAEKAERARAVEHHTWGGHAWSREDDRGHVELTVAHSLALRYHVPLTAIYAVLEQGIREHWPGPDGEPLTPFTPPQDPRSTW